jgi:hypothetical protein
MPGNRNSRNMRAGRGIGLRCGIGLWFTMVLGVPPAHVAAQTEQLAMFAGPPPGAPATHPDDPAFAVYRDGYNLILDERWEAARKVFDELIRLHPRSMYRDDAAYWTAFSWKHTDRRKAMEAYRRFVRDHPQSRYMDDAFADLQLLEVEEELHRVRQQLRAPEMPREIRVRIPQELRRMEAEFTRQLRAEGAPGRERMEISREGDTLLARIPEFHFRLQFTQESADPETRLQLKVLQALSERGDDPRTAQALQEIVLDRKHPAPLRVSALHMLAGSHVHDHQKVFLEVARNDTSEEIQRTAIELLARSGPERRHSVEQLIQLFRVFDGTPGTRGASHGRLGTTLYAIATIGDQRATEFLADVARSHPDEAIRGDAVFYLGTIGSESAREALLRLLEKTP